MIHLVIRCAWLFVIKAFGHLIHCQQQNSTTLGSSEGPLFGVMVRLVGVNQG